MEDLRIQEQFCRLCQNRIIVGNYKVTEVQKSEISDSGVLVLKLDLHVEENKEVVCSDCSVKLQAALQFKAICINTNSTIALSMTQDIPYIGSKSTSSGTPLDLTLLYQIGKDDNQTTIQNVLKICRLCMRLVSKNFKSLEEVEMELIQSFIPEMNFALTKDPVICETCSDYLINHYNFLTNYLNLEKRRHLMQDDETNSRQFSNADIRIKTEDIDIGQEEDKTDFQVNVNYAQENGENVTELSIKTEEVDIKIEETDLEVEIQDKTERQRPWQKWMRFPKRKRAPAPPKILCHNCGFCDYTTRLLSKLRKHLKTHRDPSEIKWVHCESCDYKTEKRSLLRGHKRRIHENIQCNLCDYKTGTVALLDNHIEAQHPSKVQWYICDICGSKIKHKHNLTEHLNSHKSLQRVQRHRCGFCEFVTVRLSEMMKHLDLHKDPSDKFYKCKSCDYKTKFKGRILDHMVRHI